MAGQFIDGRFFTSQNHSLRMSSCLFLTVVTFAGCMRGSHELDTAVVTGRVTLDGEPLTSGVVYVIPAKGRNAKGLIRKDGTFTLSTYRDGDGAQVGTHPVIITAIPRDEMDAEARALRVPVPQRYARAGTSGLTLEVKSRTKNEIEFALINSGG